MSEGDDAIKTSYHSEYSLCSFYPYLTFRRIFNIYFFTYFTTYSVAWVFQYFYIIRWFLFWAEFRRLFLKTRISLNANIFSLFFNARFVFIFVINICFLRRACFFIRLLIPNWFICFFFVPFITSNELGNNKSFSWKCQSRKYLELFFLMKRFPCVHTAYTFHYAGEIWSRSFFIYPSKRLVLEIKYDCFTRFAFLELD